MTLPKFSVPSQLSLRPTLEALGVTDAFDEKRADFSRMDGKKDLDVSDAVHQATIDVDENGTEAAAATGLVVHLYSRGPVGPLVVDRPFVFVIRDDATGAILFAGRVTDPTS